jgi:hypothetical protein
MARFLLSASLCALLSIFPAMTVHAAPSTPELDEAKKLVRCATLTSMSQNWGPKTPAEKIMLPYFALTLMDRAGELGATKEMQSEWAKAFEKDVTESLGWSVEARRQLIMPEMEICMPILKAEGQAFEEHAKARRDGRTPAPQERARQ